MLGRLGTTLRRFDPLRLRRHLRLRTKTSLFFSLLALVATVTMTLVTYTIARSSLLNERTTEAEQLAFSNARLVLGELRAGRLDNFGDWFEGAINPEEHGFNQVRLPDGTEIAPNLNSPDAFPVELRAAVDEGQSGRQRFTFDGERYVGVGIHLAGVDADYFEAFPLRSTERTLRTLVIAFSVGSAVTVLLAGAIGVWTSRRLLRPLERITTAAELIASGDLATRLTPEHDRDLQPLVSSFNGMADAVQTRIQREERFASDVSHELRSPITALAAATDILERRRDELPDRTKQVIDVVIDQVRRFDGMVLDLLELSRIDAGAADLHLETSPIGELCQRIARKFGFGELRIDIDPQAPNTVVVDRIRFERILGNLLGNAEHHGGGPTRISIEAAPEGAVDIAVEDAGPGVDEEERTRIFERFARGNTSRHRVGTGLGLALVAEHVHALGGEVSAEERPGGGARFVVRLPAREAAPEVDG